MSSLILPASLRQQPQQAAKPNLAWKPLHLWSMVGNGYIDHAGGMSAFEKRSNVTPKITRHGWAGAGNGATGADSGYVSGGGFGQKLDNLHELTWFAVFTLDALSANECVLMRADADGNTAGFIALDVFPTAGAFTIRPLVVTYTNTGWTTAVDNAAAAVAVGGTYLVIARFRDGTALQSAVVPLGGSNLTWGGSFAPTGGVNTTGATSFKMHIAGTTNTAAASAPGPVHLAGFLPYYASDAQVKALAQNPWQLFAAPARDLWIAPASSASIALRNSWTNAVPASPLSIVTSTLAKDVLVAHAVNDNNTGTYTWPTNFVQNATTSSSLDGQIQGAATLANATGSEGSLSISNSGGALIGGILAYSGVDNTTPLDVAAVTSAPVAANSPWTASASLTTVTDGCRIVALIGDDVAASATVTHSVATTAGVTGAWTKHYELTDSTGFRNCAAFSATQTTKGAVTVTYTGTAAGINAAPRLILLALRPATTVGAASINGTLAATLGAATASAAAAASVAANSSATLGAATLAAAGTAPAIGINGTLGATLGGITGAASGAVSVSASASSSLASLALAASGANATGANLSATLGTLSASAAASAQIAAAAAKTLNALSAASAASVAISGSAAQTLGTTSASAAAAVSVAASLGSTLGAATLAALGTVAALASRTADLSVTLGVLTGAGQGTANVAAVTSVTLAALSANAQAAAPNTGSTSATLGAATLAATGTASQAGAVNGTLSATLAVMTGAGSGAVAVSASASRILADVAVTSSGAAQIQATAGFMLGALTTVPVIVYASAPAGVGYTRQQRNDSRPRDINARRSPS